MKKMEGPLEVRIPRLLLKYRVTPHVTTGIAPAEMLMGGRVKTHLDLLYPATDQSKQATQKENHDKHHHPKIFEEGEWVMARNFATTGTKWLPDKVKETDPKGPSP